ncbi:MAG: hypothetical protein QM541_11905 [Flavobacterium sp.]|nr:hypothetical protein [Flavobacterium sp.]
MFDPSIIQALDQIGKASLRKRKEDELDWLNSDHYYSCLFKPRRDAYTQNDVFYVTTSVKEFVKSTFGKVLNEISQLEEDWDGYGAIPPSSIVISNTTAFLEILPSAFRENLDAESIMPNPNGTITVEWRKDNDDVISVEIGKSVANYYVMIGGAFDGFEDCFLPKTTIPVTLLKKLAAF